MSQSISNLTAGSLVKLNENGTPKKFIFLEYNHYAQGEVTLIRKDTFSPGAWKASYSVNATSYNGCNLDQFCNVVFPDMLDKTIQASMVNVPIPVTLGYIYGNSTMYDSIVTLWRKGFALSTNEAANTAGYQAEGTAFEYFSTNASRIAYHDETTTATGQWLRSPSGTSTNAYCVSNGGAATTSTTMQGNSYSYRPAITLRSDILVSDTVDSDGCYTIEWVPVAEDYRKIDGKWLKMV